MKPSSFYLSLFAMFVCSVGLGMSLQMHNAWMACLETGCAMVNGLFVVKGFNIGRSS